MIKATPKPKLTAVAKPKAPAKPPAAPARLKAAAPKPKAKLNSGANETHAWLSPSGAKKWLGCAAALTCEQSMPNTSSAAAEEGTMMHYVAELVINLYLQDKTLVPCDKYVGGYPMQKPDGKGTGPLFTAEHAKQSQAWADYVIGLVDAGADVFVEYKVDLNPVFQDMWVPVTDEFGGRTYGPDGKLKMEQLDTAGTADLVAWLKLADGSWMLIVGDLKTGRIGVPAQENKQMMIYALGLLAENEDRNISVVRLVICQPNAGGISEWDILPEALRIFQKFAYAQAEKAVDAFNRRKKGLKSGDFSPSADACQWCRFRDNCQPRIKWAESVINIDLADDHTEVAEPANFGSALSAEALGEAYAKLPALQNHIKIITDEVMRRLDAGEPVTGYKLGYGKAGSKFWTDQEAALAAMKSSRLKDDEIYKKSLITPTQALALVSDKPRVITKLNALIDNKPASKAIVPDDVKRHDYHEAKDADLAD